MSPPLAALDRGHAEGLKQMSFKISCKSFEFAALPGSNVRDVWVQDIEI